MSVNGNGHLPGALRDVLEDARAFEGCSMKALTVLATQHDPFRLDTPAGHRDGQWFAEVTAELWDDEDPEPKHLRAVHYVLVSRGVIKPNGLPYLNNDRDWKWMSETAAKAARWLGYVPWRLIVDNRNAEPVTVTRGSLPPEPYITAGVEVEIPDAEAFQPRVAVHGFTGTQPYRLVIYGEKTSLEPVLGRIAKYYGASLYLPSGEISDTQLYDMALRGHGDGRPMVVLTFADSDPAGWQMPVSIGRKLQAFRAGLFPDLEFQVHRVALTPEQVGEHDLPDTPLKETERRANAWTQATGTRQTEIDALATLEPDTLTSIAKTAVRPFFDTSLEVRVYRAQQAWLEEAQARLDAGLGPEAREQIRAEALAKVEQARELIDELNDSLSAEVPDIELPEIVIPDPEVTGDYGTPLVDSGWEWAAQTRALIRDRAYEEAE
jgi:hypothetical protein